MADTKGKALNVASARGAITKRSNAATIHGAVVKDKNGKAIAHGLSGAEQGSKEHVGIAGAMGGVMATHCGFVGKGELEKQLRKDLQQLAKATARANAGVIGYGDFSLAVG